MGDLRGSPRDQAESVRHRHPLVHLCGRQQARWKRPLFFTGPIQLDGNGNVYIMGQTGTGFPLVNPVEPTPTGGSLQVLVAELDPTGANLLFSTTIGSDGLNTANPAGLAVDSAGNIYLAGNTSGPNLITTPGAFQTDLQRRPLLPYGNGFVVKIASQRPYPSCNRALSPMAQRILPEGWYRDPGRR